MTDVASTSVAVLTQSVLRSMFMMKLKTIAVALVLVGSELTVRAWRRLKPIQESRRRCPARLASDCGEIEIQGPARLLSLWRTTWSSLPIC